MSVSVPSRTRLVARIGVAQLIGYGGTYYLPAILAAPIGRELGLSSNWTFGGLSLALVVSSFIGPAVGRYVDRGGGRRALVASNFAFALGLTLLGLANGLAMTIAAWLFIGLGCGLGYYETAFAALTRLYGVSARRLISGVTLIAGFTSTVSWPLMAWLEAHAGWRGTCFFWVAANLMIALPLNLTLPAPGVVVEPEAASGERSRQPVVLDASSERRAMTAIALMFTATAIVSSGLSAIMPNLLAHFGVSHTTAILASALIGPAQVIGRLAEMGWLTRYHPLVSARLATMFLPIGTGAFVLGGAAFAVPFTMLYGLGNGILTIARGSLPLAIFGPAGYGRRVGLLSAPSRMAAAAAPVAVGMLFDASPTTGLFAMVACNLIGFAALFIISTRARH
ncbi:MAG: MFS transporter [Methylobacteriaceae bacterium]|nr:MFS transporter [Methylobacteriaceae bacterium]MCC0001914.1 MFS transporter [Methylobacteriaceae bacterium]